MKSGSSESTKRVASSAVELSPLDEQRFGVRTAKGKITAAGDVAALMDFCRARAVELLIVRCPTSDLATAQALEAIGGRLMDVLLYSLRDLQKTPLPSGS